MEDNRLKEGKNTVFQQNNFNLYFVIINKFILTNHNFQNDILFRMLKLARGNGILDTLITFFRQSLRQF